MYLSQQNWSVNWAKNVDVKCREHFTPSLNITDIQDEYYQYIQDEKFVIEIKQVFKYKFVQIKLNC